MKIKLLSALLTFALLTLVGVSSVSAATLNFSPSTATTTKDSVFEITVNINTESVDTMGADVFVSYDVAKLQPTSVANGGFYPSFNYANPAGSIEIHALSNQANVYKNGSGAVAKITFKAIASDGTSNISFVCTGGSGGSQIISSSLTNILNCNTLDSAVVSFSSTSDNPTPTPTEDTGGTDIPGEPNSCGGTCGSNYNCQSGLFCYGGYCRNPSCPSDSDCNCSVIINITPTPKVTPKPTVKPKKTATPKPGSKSSSPSPYVIQFLESPNPFDEQPLVTEEELVEEEPVGLNNRAISMIIGAVALILFLIGFALIKRKKKIEPPIIETPSGFSQGSWPAQPQNDNPPFPSEPTFGAPPAEFSTPPAQPVAEPPQQEKTVNPPTLTPPTSQEPPTVY